MCSGCPSVRPSVSPLSVNTYFTRRDTSVFSVCMCGGVISMKLGTIIHHMKGRC